MVGGSGVVGKRHRVATASGGCRWLIFGHSGFLCAVGLIELGGVLFTLLVGVVGDLAGEGFLLVCRVLVLSHGCAIWTRSHSSISELPTRQ